MALAVRMHLNDRIYYIFINQKITRAKEGFWYQITPEGFAKGAKYFWEVN